MNEPTTPTSPASPPPADPVQRVLMDRARAQAERDAVKPPRRPVLMLAGFVFALAAVLAVGIGFDRFVASIQRVMHLYDEQDRAEEVQRAKQPMPAFVVAAPDAAADAAPAAPKDAPKEQPGR
jgi:hypothetical protein